MTAECTPPVYPLHVVLLLDASSDLDPTVRDAIRDAAAELVRCILTEDDPWLKVAVLDYAATARQLCPFSSDRDAQLSCLARLRPRTGRRIDTALTAARAALDRERNKLPAWMGNPEEVVREVVVLVAGGENDFGCTPALRAASALKRRGVLVMSVWANPTSDSPCPRRMATSPRYYFEHRPGSEPCRVFDRIREDIINISIHHLTITHTLPANVIYEPSGDPELAPTVVPGYLVWSTTYVPRDGYTATARLKPLDVGHLRIVSETRAAWRWGYRNSGSLTIPGPELDVLPPRPSATPTAPQELTPTPTVRARKPLYMPAVDHP